MKKEDTKKLTFEQRQAIARKAVETRRARLAAATGVAKTIEKPNTANKPEGWHEWGAGKKAAWTRKFNTSEVVADALEAMVETRNGDLSAHGQADCKLDAALERLSDIKEGTVVSVYDQGWRFATFVSATRDWTILMSIPAYKKHPTKFKARTISVYPAF